MKEKLKLPPNQDGHVWHHVPRGRIHHMHRHDELEFNFVTRGRGRYLLGDRRYDLRRHSLVWLFPGQEHILLDMSPDFENWIAVFRPKVVRAACRRMGSRDLLAANPPGDFCRYLSREDGDELVALSGSLINAQRDPARMNAGLGYLLQSSWVFFQRARSSPEGVGLHPGVERAALLIADEPAHRSLDELAQAANLSPAHLSRLFKQQMGVSLSHYRNRQRIRRFLDLYGDGQRVNMLQASLDAGFGSYPPFHRVFKQLMGVGPADYRRGLEPAGTERTAPSAKTNK